MRILIIKQSSLGDVLHASGHIRALREQFVDAEIVVLTSLACAPVLRGHPDINQLIELDRGAFAGGWLHGWQELRRVLRIVRHAPFDLALDLQGLARSVFFLYAAKASKKFVKGRYPFVRGFRNRSLHAVDELTGVLGAAGVRVRDSSMVFSPTEAARHRAQALSANYASGYIVVSPLSRHPMKDWPIERYEEYLRALLNHEHFRQHVFLSGAGDAQSLLSGLAERIRSDRVQSVAGELDIDAFGALTEGADLVVTGDSFAMHLACSFATPLLCFLGPTRESQIGPRSVGPTCILRASNCDGCRRPRLCTRHCLAELQPERVVTKTLQMLNQLH